MSDKEWLDNLRVGDEVCYYSKWHGYVIETIEKITPTKQIKTRSHTYKNGYCRLDAWDGLRLEPVTQDVKNSIRSKFIYSQIRDFPFEKLNLEQLEKIYAVIEKSNSLSGGNET